MLSKLNSGNTLTIIGMAGAFAVFLMRYEARISKIENTAEEHLHRIERAEGLIRDMYPKVEKNKNDIEWLLDNHPEKK